MGTEVNIMNVHTNPPQHLFNSSACIFNCNKTTRLDLDANCTVGFIFTAKRTLRDLNVNIADKHRQTLVKVHSN